MFNIREAGSASVTPIRRTSLAPEFLTPKTRGTPRELMSDIGENNDEAERKSRQLNRLQRRRSKAIDSPVASPSDRRRSLNAVAGLTNQQLSDHYQQCIQLSAQNKINVKNAFNLQLIDYMTVMLNRNDSDMNNFQVASCTLDASTKIYAYRVDSIHTDTLKMAGGLGRTKEAGVKVESNTEETDINRKKKKKRGSTVETVLKNLDVSSFDLEFDGNPLFKKMASQFDEGQNAGVLFMNSFPVLNDYCQLVLDSETVLGSEEEPEMKEIKNIVLPPFPDLNLQISPTFSSFEFKNWNPDDQPLVQSAPESHKDDHAFDMNAIPEALDFDQMENNDMDDDDPPLDLEDDNQESAPIACKMKPASQLEVAHLKDHLAIGGLEYSYFDTKVMSAWAGPGHWKLKPLLKNLQNKTISTKDKKKKEFEIDYSDNVDVDSHFAVTRKAIKLSTNTVKKWSLENTTLPVDLHYEPTKLARLFLRDRITLKSHETTVCVDDSIKEYDYDNSNDQENYCPNVADSDPYCEPMNTLNDFSQTVLESQNGNQTADFFGDNLVAAPNKVAKINIGYARTAKKMDMRRLKSTIWMTLSQSSFDKENDQQCANVDRQYKDCMDIGKKVCFEEVYTDLQTKLPQTMAENLSIPLAFVASLHLANEHNLKFESISVLGDFLIQQD